MDRDHWFVMIGISMLLVATMSCQQGQSREASGDVGTALPLRPPPVETRDSAVQAAQTELLDGRAARATRIVMPVLRTPERRTPEALLVAARAAADWHGWTLVNALLRFEPWLETRFGGEGLELLARSALERGDATAAREHSEAALRVATDNTARAVRRVLLARSLDRLDATDSAAAMYSRGADGLPMVRDWLRLRAAGATRDAEARERLYERINTPAAKDRIAYTEAQTLERFGLELAAAQAYEKIGDVPSAYRLRLASDYEPAQRSTLRAGLLGYIQRDARGDTLARALDVLDAAFPTLDATSQLLVTRRASEAGLSARAASGFAQIPSAQLTDADVLAMARAMIATGKPTDAATRLGRHRFGASNLREGQYLRALALLRSGRTTAARTALQRIISAHPASRHSADARYLLADLESDAGRDSRARDLLATSCTSATPGGYSDDACFRSGILSFALGNASRAAGAFDEMLRRFPKSGDVVAATYWSGRSWERAGNQARARERWREVLQREPLSYYASAAARRLDTTQWTPAPAILPRSAALTASMNRAAALEYLGMEVEERYEYAQVEKDAGKSTDQLLAAGSALLERGESVRAIRLGWKAVTAGREKRDSAGRVDERGYSLAYPVLEEVELIARSRENNLDPALVAAVIRQESSWNPHAVSRAGARGLMQIMPSVGEAIARSKRYPMWDAALLFEPNVSLELGTSHLRAALSEYSSLPRALAAYNAGGSRVNRWAKRTGAADPEIFTERISFTETRDYVRIVLRNVELYRALHGLKK
jgi:soluble lytic murein transglycosylase